MNAFYEHHEHSIRAGYRCFDRILLNGLIQPFQQPERVVGFFSLYRNFFPVTRKVLTGIADQFQSWTKDKSEKWGAAILEAPAGRREEFVEPYFRSAKPDLVVAIIKAREPSRIMTAIGTEKNNRWHLQIAQRWVIQYNFYVNDSRWGRIFVRMCSYLPFSARICLNQHHWLANRLQEENIDFGKTSNAFLKCGDFTHLQELADSLSARDLLTCGHKWLARFTPFFKEQEHTQAGCQHRLFFAQVEYRDNLIFHRRAALDALGERLLDANWTIGQPDKITGIFGRKITRRHRGKLQTEIEDMYLPDPVIRSHYANGFINRYVRDHLTLRTEAATNNVNDHGVKISVENLPQLRQKLTAINDSYQNIQRDIQDIPEIFVHRGPLRQLAATTILPAGKRIPGLKLDRPRRLALMHPLVRFSHIAAGSAFTTAGIYPYVAEAPGNSPSPYSLASLRYDLSKLRANNLVEKLPHSRRYRLLPNGNSICLIFLKLSERIYAPLTAGLLSPLSADGKLQHNKRTQLDRLYQRLIDDLDNLIRAVGLKAA
ncbi:MAG TPA: hypothetical protein VMT53_21730 [Terriglobales bacterium]|nr:hypothetical protein [Terriglobales bacterium]